MHEDIIERYDTPDYFADSILDFTYVQSNDSINFDNKADLKLFFRLSKKYVLDDAFEKVRYKVESFIELIYKKDYTTGYVDGAWSGFELCP